MNPSLKMCQRAVKSYLAPAVVLAAMGVGCASGNKPADRSLSASLKTNPAVTEIAPTPPAPSFPAAYTAAPAYTPAAPATTVLADAGTLSTAAPTAAASGGSTYTVKRGDTLFKIAREQYGDAKAWKKIASANPTVAGGVIKTGQKLVLP